MKYVPWMALLLPLWATAGVVVESAPAPAPAPAGVAPAAPAAVKVDAPVAAIASPVRSTAAVAPLAAPVAAAVTPSPAPAVAPLASPVKRWEVRASDVNLHRSFERWGEEAGYRVKWDAPKHSLVGAPDVTVGTFQEAVRKALMSPGIRYGEMPLEACIYPNTPPLLRITREGEQVRSCPLVIND